MLLKKNSMDFAKNGSIHGVKYIADPTASIFERIFWILIIISSLSSSIYLTSLFWSRYTSNPTRTLIDTNVAPTTTVPFPGITICNLNTVIEAKLDNLLSKFDANDHELIATKNIISKMTLTETSSRNTRPVTNLTELSIAKSVLEKNGFEGIKMILARVSQSCEDMIIRCAWNQVQVQCRDLFEETYNNQGRCCSFNYVRKDSFKHIIYTLYYGLSTGLRVMLVPAYNNRNMAGVKVTIHNPEDFPGAYNDLTKTLSIGQLNYMEVQGTKQKCSDDVKALHVAHRQCIYSDEKNLGYFESYTYSNCLSLCEALMVMDKCKCVPHYYDFIREMPYCNLQNLPCLDNFDYDIIHACDCPSQCEDDFYDVLLTTAKFINNSNVWMMDYLRDYNDTENSILLNVFFATNRQTILLRDTITSGIYLISSFGGIYSLFLGCSIITVIEILYYFIVQCFIQHIRANKIKNSDEAVHIFTITGISRKLNEPEYYADPVVPFIN